MSEDPAPYWTLGTAPYHSRERDGWIAVAVWTDATTGHKLKAEWPSSFATRDEALSAGQDLADDPILRDELLDLNPRDMEAYWRRRCSWLYGDSASAHDSRRTTSRASPRRRTE